MSLAEFDCCWPNSIVAGQIHLLLAEFFCHRPNSVVASRTPDQRHRRPAAVETAPRAHTRKVHSKVPCFECTLNNGTEFICCWPNSIVVGRNFSCWPNSIVAGRIHLLLAEFDCCGWIPFLQTGYRPVCISLSAASAWVGKSYLCCHPHSAGTRPYLGRLLPSGSGFPKKSRSIVKVNAYSASFEQEE